MKRVVKVTQAMLATVNEDLTIEERMPLEFVGKHLTKTQVENKVKKDMLLGSNDFFDTIVIKVKHLLVTYEMPVEEFTKFATVKEIEEVQI